MIDKNLDTARAMAQQNLAKLKKIEEIGDDGPYIRVGIGRSARYARVSHLALSRGGRKEVDFEEQLRARQRALNMLRLPVPHGEKYRLRFEHHDVWKRWAKIMGVKQKYIDLPLPQESSGDLLLSA